MPIFFLLLLLFASPTVEANDLPLDKSMKVELRNPTYNDGVLKTSEGGIIEGSDFYLQARNITYVRQDKTGAPINKIYADGELYFVWHGRPYIGEKIDFDVNTRIIVITNGCTLVAPWYVGGKTINLNPEGSGIITDAFLTTSENEKNDWSVKSKKVDLSKGGKVKAKDVGFFFVRLPILWLPTFSTDLKKGHSSPIKYQFRLGGPLGPRVGLSYNLYHENHIKADLLLDLLLRKGIGGGVVVNYENPNKKEKFTAYNYVAHDVVSREEHKELRYRFRGEYDNLFFNDGVGFKLTYDKLSDLSMRSDYMNQGLDSTKILPTEARFFRKCDNYMSSLNTKIRLNQFQTIKQELPLFTWNGKPLELGRSHFILQNNLSAGMLDYKYATETRHVQNFHSSRIELGQKLYRTFYLAPLFFTPEVGYNLVNYNNSPSSASKTLELGRLGAECHTRFFNTFAHGRDILEPYVQYEFITTPSVKPHEHYLFDIQDGYSRLNTLRFGLRNFLFSKSSSDFLRTISCDLYSRAFFRTPHVLTPIPKIYADLNLKPTPYTAYSAQFAWDRFHNVIDHFNIKGDFTVNDDIAFTLEYRTRSRYAWRKLDPENFILDSYRAEHDLLHSEVSDERDTALGGIFFRLTPSLWVDLKTRYGFGRPNHKRYNAYEADISTIVRGALKVVFSIQKRNHEWRYSVDFDVGLEVPKFGPATKIGQMNYDN
jgi:hypothetical protein